MLRDRISTREMKREEKSEEVETGNIRFEQEEEEYIIAGSSDDDEDELDFSFVPQFQEETGIDLAGNIFSNGQIHPVYPVFGQSLIPNQVLNLDLMNISTEDGRMEKAENESTPEPGTYCVWSPKLDAPSLDPSKKSRSTGGSSSKRWRLMDFVVGRSKSDGKQKLMYLVPYSKTDKESGDKDKIVTEKTTTTKKKDKMTKESNMMAAHRLYYAKDGGASGSKPKTYLPYRKNLVGFQPF